MGTMSLDQSTASVSKLNGLLDKSNRYDKDERFMATSDLCGELTKDLKLDEAMERRICTAGTAPS
mgnify:CR=1 FL=1